MGLCPCHFPTIGWLLVILNLVHSAALDTPQTMKRLKRERAFDLLRIESEFEQSDESVQLRLSPSRGQQRGANFRRDEVFDDDKCQRRCNERIRSGLDMVNAHTSFGSIGVPSVVDQLDLQMFCRLDAEHDRCLRGCGYEVQFNMRDYVCKERYAEMVANLACYSSASSLLKRQCGDTKCGPYKGLEVTLQGYGERCRQLSCDLEEFSACTKSVLIAECGREAGLRAAKFLADYSRTQVLAWMKDASSSMKKRVPEVTPTKCAHLLCESSSTNCTSTTRGSTPRISP